jgi:hypothetical protein
VHAVGQRLGQNGEVVIDAQEVLRIAPREVLALATRGTTGQRSTRPGRSAKKALCSSAPHPRRPFGPADLSTSSRIGGRSGRNRAGRFPVAAGRPRAAVVRNGRASGRSPRDRRPGRNRSTVSCRRRRRSCVDLRTRALARGEVLGQALDDVPLRGAGVLCFVYKNVVDPAIQPEQHPLRDAGGQKLRPRDEVVEIEPAARGLGGLVGGQEHRGEAVQRMGLARVQKAEAQGSRASTRSVSSAKASITSGRSRRGSPCFRSIGPWRQRVCLCGASGQAHALQLGERVERHRLPWHGAQHVCESGLVAFSRDRTGQIASQISLVTGEDHCENPRLVQGGIDPIAATASQPSGGSNASAMPGNGAASCIMPSSSPRYGTTASMACCRAGSSAISSRRSAIRRPCTRSSISVKPGLTPASSGKRRRTEAQKEWIVWIFSPPGVSMARAKACARATADRGQARLKRRPLQAPPQVVFGRHRPGRRGG